MDLSRRDFLKVSFVAGGGLVVAVYLAGCKETPTPETTPTDVLPTSTIELLPTTTPTPELPAWLTPNVFVKIGNDGLVTITVHRSELGQGVRTGLPMILADELGADWKLVRVEQALGDIAYGDQATGGSFSVQNSYTTLRRAGAVARQILVNAAAQTWDVAAEECYTENSLVIHRPSGNQIPFSQLITLASTLPVPANLMVKLKDPSEFRIIGTSKGRVDNPEILTGKANFGMDVKLPGMLYGVVARSPVIGGKVISYDDSATRQVTGVREVLQIDNGIAVVAEGSWQALQGRSVLKVEWDPGPNASLNSVDLEQEVFDRANLSTPSADELVQYYTMSFFAHATMEPMNCTADVRSESCEIWVPTQNPQAALDNVISILGSKSKKNKVHVTLAGGAFGRRMEGGPAGLPRTTDYVREAVQISQALGVPIHLMWTRQDDFEHDMYHPMTVTRVKARLNDIKSLEFMRYTAASPIPVGYWRSVENNPEAFARESFIDEFAVATGVDPVEVKRKYLPERAQAVVDTAAKMAGWGSSMPEGMARGVAFHDTWGNSYVAQVVEVQALGNEIKVPRVYCAVDCGLAINPDLITAQMESGIVFALTATLKQPMLIENGKATKVNYLDYPILRFDEMPQVEVKIISSDKAPTGIGEMANPVTPPAVANAVFALTGQRLRKLPLRLE